MASFWKDGSNNRYYVGRQFVYNNNHYVGSSSLFTTLGFTEVTIATRPDDRFYIVTGPDINGAYSTTDRPVADLKTDFKNAQRTHMRATLRSSVEEVLFAFQESRAIATPWANFRADALTAKEDNDTLIDAVTTASGMESLVTAEKWVLVTPGDLADGYELNTNDYLEPMPLSPDDQAEITGTLTITRNGANLQSALFGGTYYDDVGSSAFAYDLTLRLVTNNVTESYSMPNGFSNATQLGTGAQDVELKYNDEVIATFTVADVTTPQAFNF